MATINVSFDTVTKACTITKDGAEITDVSYLSVSRKYDYDSNKPSEKFSFNVSSGWRDEAGGTSEYHQLCAADDGSLVPVPKDAEAVQKTFEAALLNK